MYRLIGVIEEIADLIYVKDIAGGGVEVYRYDPLINAKVRLGTSKQSKDKFELDALNNLQYETSVCSTARNIKNEYALIVAYTLWAKIKRANDNAIKNYSYDQYMELWDKWCKKCINAYLWVYSETLWSIISEKSINIYPKSGIAKNLYIKVLMDDLERLKRNYEQ